MAKKWNKRNVDAAIAKLRNRLERSQFAIGVGVEDVVHEPSGLRMPVLAAIHEYGSSDGRIPARAPFGSTVARNRRTYPGLVAKTVRAVVRSNSVRPARQLGSRVVADVQQSISAGLKPALEPATIAAKGSSKPLIDTGAFRQSISFEVLGRGKSI